MKKKDTYRIHFFLHLIHFDSLFMLNVQSMPELSIDTVVNFVS